MPPAGNVAANRVERTNELSKSYSRLDLANPFLRLLPFAKSANVVRRRLQCFAKVGSNLLPRGCEVRFADAKSCAVESIEFAGVAQQGFIAGLSDILDDPGRGPLGLSQINRNSIDQSIDDRLPAFAGD